MYKTKGPPPCPRAVPESESNRNTVISRRRRPSERCDGGIRLALDRNPSRTEEACTDFHPTRPARRGTRLCALQDRERLHVEGLWQQVESDEVALCVAALVEDRRVASEGCGIAGQIDDPARPEPRQGAGGIAGQSDTWRVEDQDVRPQVVEDAAPKRGLQSLGVHFRVENLRRTQIGAQVADRGDAALRGFEETIRIYELGWREE